MKFVDSSSTVHLRVHEVKADAAMQSDEGKKFEWDGKDDFVAMQDLQYGSTLWITSRFAHVKMLRNHRVHGGYWVENSPDCINKLLHAPENKIPMEFWHLFPKIPFTLPVMGEMHDALNYVRNVQFIKSDDLSRMEIMIQKISKFRHACQSNCLFFSRNYR